MAEALEPVTSLVEEVTPSQIIGGGHWIAMPTDRQQETGIIGTYTNNGVLNQIMVGGDYMNHIKLVLMET